MHTIALVLSIIFFIAGLLGTILPVLPGAVLVYAGMLLYGFMTGFTTLDARFFILQAFVMALIFFVDFISSAIATQHFGGSKYAAWGAVIGSIIGVLFLGPLGIVAGPFLGAVGAELILGKDVHRAIHVGFGTLIGVLGGNFLKLCAEIAMIIYFFIRI